MAMVLDVRRMFFAAGVFDEEPGEQGARLCCEPEVLKSADSGVRQEFGVDVALDKAIFQYAAFRDDSSAFGTSAAKPVYRRFLFPPENLDAFRNGIVPCDGRPGARGRMLGEVGRQDRSVFSHGSRFYEWISRHPVRARLRLTARRPPGVRVRCSESDRSFSGC